MTWEQRLVDLLCLIYQEFGGVCADLTACTTIGARLALVLAQVEGWVGEAPDGTASLAARLQDLLNDPGNDLCVEDQSLALDLLAALGAVGS